MAFGQQNPVDVAEEEVKTDVVDTTDESEEIDNPDAEGSQQEDDDESLGILETAARNIGISDIDPDFLTLPEDMEADTVEASELLMRRSIELGGQMFFEKYISSNPLMHQAYIHFSNGGTLETFNQDAVAPYSIDAIKGNIEAQKMVYQDYYKSKGLDEATINIIISKSIDDGTFEENSIKLAEAKNKQAEDKIKEREAQTAKEREEYEAFENGLLEAVEARILQNDFSNTIRVPDTKKKEFYDNFLTSLQIVGKNAFYVIPVEDEKSLKEAMRVDYQRRYAKEKEATEKQEVRKMKRPDKVVKEEPKKEDKGKGAVDLGNYFKNY